MFGENTSDCRPFLGLFLWVRVLKLRKNTCWAKMAFYRVVGRFGELFEMLR